MGDGNDDDPLAQTFAVNDETGVFVTKMWYIFPTKRWWNSC